MHRIGIAASKMARGNLVLYNFYVLLLTFLFSLLVFLIAGSSIMLALIIIGFIVEGLAIELTVFWAGVVRVCMVSLTVVLGMISILAVARNIRINSFAGKNAEKKK